MRSAFEEEDEDNTEGEEHECKALHNKNTELKKTVQEMPIKENQVAEDYEIEKMSVQILEEYLKSLEEDRMKMTCKVDMHVQNLKQEKHKLHSAASQSRKDTEAGKLEIKQLKCNGEIMRSKIIIKLISSHQLKLDITAKMMTLRIQMALQQNNIEIRRI